MNDKIDPAIPVHYIPWVAAVITLLFPALSYRGFYSECEAYFGTFGLFDGSCSAAFISQGGGIYLLALLLIAVYVSFRVLLVSQRLLDLRRMRGGLGLLIAIIGILQPALAIGRLVVRHHQFTFTWLGSSIVIVAVPFVMLAFTLGLTWLSTRTALLLLKRHPRALEQARRLLPICFVYWVAMETFLLFDPTSFNLIRAIIMPLLFVIGCHLFLNYSKQIRVVYAGSRVRNNKALMRMERQVINKLRRLLRT